MLVQKKLFLYSLFIIINLTSLVHSQEETFIRCQDGVAVKDKDFCPNVMDCPDNLIKE